MERAAAERAAEEVSVLAERAVAAERAAERAAVLGRVGAEREGVRQALAEGQLQRQAMGEGQLQRQALDRSGEGTYYCGFKSGRLSEGSQRRAETTKGGGATPCVYGSASHSSGTYPTGSEPLVVDREAGSTAGDGAMGEMLSELDSILRELDEQKREVARRKQVHCLPHCNTPCCNTACYMIASIKKQVGGSKSAALGDPAPTPHPAPHPPLNALPLCLSRHRFHCLSIRGVPH